MSSELQYSNNQISYYNVDGQLVFSIHKDELLTTGVDVLHFLTEAIEQAEAELEEEDEPEDEETNLYEIGKFDGFTTWDATVADIAESVRLEREKIAERQKISTKSIFDGQKMINHSPVVTHTTDRYGQPITVISDDVDIQARAQRESLKYPPMCDHEWVNTGMRKSWCKHCDTDKPE